MSANIRHQQHDSVLLQEACEALVWRADGSYVDGTFGRGGHVRNILANLSMDGHLYAFDKDPEALTAARKLAGEDERLTVCAGSFVGADALANENNLHGRIAGILLDLGVSSPQLDDPKRGFSFQQDGPLDMRMDPHTGHSAAEWLAVAKESELAEVLKTYGEERFARRIAAAIVRARQTKPITRTVQLAEVIKAAHPRWEKGKHPATRSFQAIRIYINQELDELERMLALSLELLCVKGRLVVISFHSLEDRITKRFMRSASNPTKAIPKHIPLQQAATDLPRFRVVGKVQRCSTAELARNRRARSAVLRVAEKAA